MLAVSIAALSEYVSDVRDGAFPEDEHTYHMLEGEHERFAEYTKG